MSRDPLVQLTRQPYSYANDNPLNAIDPSGLCDVNPFGSDSCAVNAASGVASGAEAAGNFVAKNWRPIASAGADVATAGACAFSAGALCGEAIAANAIAQSALIATGPGSTGTKIGLIGANLLLAGGASTAVGASQSIDELAALNAAYKARGWVSPFLTATGAAPYLGFTAAQLAAYPWNSC